MPIGVPRQIDAARFPDPLQSRGDIHAVAHQVAVALLDDVAKMDADTALDALFWRQASIALCYAALEFDGAAHCIDDAAEFDDCAIASALNNAPVVNCDGWVDQIAPKAAKTRERTLLVGAGKPAVADDVGDQDGRELAGFAHCAPVVVTLPQFPNWSVDPAAPSA